LLYEKALQLPKYSICHS